MKCPKCGFVSFPGLSRCKKCGHKFKSAAREESSSLFTSLFSSSPPVSISPASTPSPEPERVIAPQEDGAVTSAEVEGTPVPVAHEPPDGVTRGSPTLRPWRTELAERVQGFRRRRARLHGESDSSENLGLDFTKGQDLEVPVGVDDKVLEFSPGETDVDVHFGEPSIPAGQAPVVESILLEKSRGGLHILDSAAVQAGELDLESAAPEGEPVEILVGESELPSALGAAEVSPLVLPLAPLGQRFLAGLADALVLLLGACLFALIFWRAGGHLTPGALNLAILGVIAVFFLFVYFGLFTVFAASTPGQLWIGLEVRNLDGAQPTAREAFWRAFGYLVSISALMLGFVWALVDSESLTWHDRMSGTFLVISEHEVAVESPRPEP